MTRPTVFFPAFLRSFSPLCEPASPWTEHIAVAYDLVAALRPRLVVSVGVRHGAAFFACLQSARENDIDLLGYAVGFPSPDASESSMPGSPALDDFARHARAYHGDTSYVLPATYESAITQFDDGSIDLLLLDEDCDDSIFPAAGPLWRPKLRPGGVLFAHDAGPPDSSRRAAWDTVALEHPKLTFTGPPPLGLIRLPGPPAADERHLRLLFESGPEDTERIRAAYLRGARYLELEAAVDVSLFGQGGRKKSEGWKLETGS